MFGKCKHQWGELERRHTPAIPNSSAEGVSEETIQMVMFGITNITQRCAVCGRTDVTTVVGKV